MRENSLVIHKPQQTYETRSSWLNCALRDDEAVYWVSIGHYEAVAVVGNSLLLGAFVLIGMKYEL